MHIFMCSANLLIPCTAGVRQAPYSMKFYVVFYSDLDKLKVAIKMGARLSIPLEDFYINALANALL